jgi:hypothetical protein
VDDGFPKLVSMRMTVNEQLLGAHIYVSDRSRFVWARLDRIQRRPSLPVLASVFPGVQL